MLKLLQASAIILSLMFLSGCGKDDKPKDEPYYKGKPVSEWVRRCKEDPMLSREVFVEIGKPAIPGLVSLLSDDDAAVRGRALDALQVMGDMSAAKPMLEHFKQETDHVNKNLYLSFYERNQYRRAIPHIKKLMFEDPYVKERAARVFGSYNDATLIPDIIRALDILENSGDYRAALIESLKKLSGEDFGKDVKKWELWWNMNQGIVTNKAKAKQAGSKNE